MVRGRLKRALSDWFATRGYVEVETACLQVSPGNEVHLHAFATGIETADGARTTAYLHTSPEFACKKLLAAGEQRLFTFAPVFRNRERGRLHHPEFTMLEWYEAGADFARLLDMTEDLVTAALTACEIGHLTYRGTMVAADAGFERITVADAFARHAGIDLDGHLRCDGTDRDALAALAAARGIRAAADDTWSDIFSKVLSATVEPELGRERPTLLTHYPASEAALARLSGGDPLYAERAELYACGVELSNGFAELTDPVQQRARFEADMAEKKRRYGLSYPIDEDFLEALELMPPAAGCALGFDRLVMLATGAPDVASVRWTPVADFEV